MTYIVVRVASRSIIFYAPRITHHVMNWQQQANDLAQRYNLHHAAAVHTLDLLSELGEVAKELLKATHYGSTEPQFHPEIADELGDVLYSLCLLATATGVDLDKAFHSTLQKYEHRWQTKGHIGSQILE